MKEYLITILENDVEVDKYIIDANSEEEAIEAAKNLDDLSVLVTVKAELA